MIDRRGIARAYSLYHTAEQTFSAPQRMQNLPYLDRQR
jgi:hypothetical protein